jgi:hypothetical protein
MFVYLVTTPELHFTKVGIWSNSIKTLISRYKTYYGSDLNVSVFQCDRARHIESMFKKHFKSQNISHELFIKNDEMINKYKAYLVAATTDFTYNDHTSHSLHLHTKLTNTYECNKINSQTKLDKQNQFLHEDISHILHNTEVMKELMQIMTSHLEKDFYHGITQFIKLINFDPSHPENVTIRHYNSSQCLVFIGSQWKLCERGEAANDILQNAHKYLQHYLSDNEVDINEYLGDKKHTILRSRMNALSDISTKKVHSENHHYKRVFRDIIYSIIYLMWDYKDKVDPGPATIKKPYSMIQNP